MRHPLGHRSWFLAAGLLATVLVWLSSMLPGIAWRGQVLERCDEALGARYGRDLGELGREYETLGASWQLTTRWHCKYRFLDNGEVVQISVSGW